MTPLGWWLLVYSTVIQFCIAYVSWFAALARLPASVAAIGTMAVPVIGVVASAIALRRAARADPDRGAGVHAGRRRAGDAVVRSTRLPVVQSRTSTPDLAEGLRNTRKLAYVIVTPINSLYATGEISARRGWGVRANSDIIRERESMARNILILGASYGSLLGTKLLMAGHNVTLVCRKKTAELINRDGTEVRIKLRDEAVHRAIFSRDLPGKLDATTPADVDLSRYDLVGLAMQEPQYTNHTIRVLMIKIADGEAAVSVDHEHAAAALSEADPGAGGHGSRGGLHQCAVWERFKPGLVTLCSPDPQAFRPPEEAANVLHVGLPTNFKAAAFEDEKHNKLLRELEADIDAVTLDGQDVPVKLKVFDSLFVPLGQMVDAADRQLPLHHAARAAVDPRRRARRSETLAVDL